MGGLDMNRIFFSTATADNSFDLSNNFCRTQTILKTNESLKKYIYNPIGNHLIVAPGNHLRPLKLWYYTFMNASQY